MEAKLIKGTTSYFVESTGRVFKIAYGKEVPVRPHRPLRCKNLIVVIEGKQKDYLNIMLQYFKPEIKVTDKISFKVSKSGLISADSITIKPFISERLSKEDELLEFKYQCAIKASSANSRAKDVLTSLQVFMSLKIHSFKCVYCQDNIKHNDWHLDHYIPLAAQGRNVFENIVPACPVCNYMKGAIQPQKFYHKCVSIAQHFMFKNDLLESDANGAAQGQNGIEKARAGRIKKSEEHLEREFKKFIEPKLDIDSNVTQS